ncbi:MAG TPA: helix-turn-helix domain-containing protein [Caulobacteraceae bacterium]|nr:helix-turn-helix domain-containing protein [Caulobacteraceae bacterium]
MYAAAISLFVEKGFDSTTMDDIAERADVARATVFNHFPRKAAFIDEWTARRRERAAVALRIDDLEGAPLRNVLKRYFTAMSAISQANAASRRETIALMNAAVHSTNVLSRSDLSQDVSRLAAHARKNGELDASADPDLIGMLAVSAYLTVLIEWISTDPAPFTLSEKVAATIDLLLDGIAPAGPIGPGTETPER